MLIILRGKNFKDLGWKKNVARLIVSYIAWRVAATLVAVLIGFIVGSIEVARGITPAPFEGASSFIVSVIPYIVGAYLAWKFVWNNEGWWKAPEQDIDAVVDLE